MNILSILAILAATSTIPPPAEFFVFPVAQTSFRGAYGSQWVTENQIRNSSDKVVYLVDENGCPWSADHACDNELSRFSTTTYRPTTDLRYQLWYISPRDDGSGSIEDLSLSSHLREIATGAESFGTALPVGRSSDFLVGPLDLLNIPVIAGQRISLRVFAMKGVADSYTVTVTPVEVDPAYLNPEDRVADVGPADSKEFSAPAFPDRHIEIHDVLSLFTLPLGTQRVRISVAAHKVSPFSPDVALWGFASMTNNDTQHITIFERQ